ncbi:hypothetical protein LSUE1_G001367, partial [Lachnellula suecica]
TVQFWLRLDTNVGQFHMAEIIIGNVVYGTIKISAVLFYKRIFTTKAFKISANLVLGAISLYIVLAFFLLLFCSRGVVSYWTTPPLEDGTEFVLNFPALNTSLAAVDIALDVAVLSLPSIVIRKLHMSFERKCWVSGIFLLGGFCLISSIIKLVYACKLFHYFTLSIDEQTSEKKLFCSRILLTISPPETFAIIELWATIEASASIFTACLPTLGPLFRDGPALSSFMGSFKSLFSRSTLSSRGQTSHPNNSSQSINSSKRKWYELHSRGQKSNITAGTPASDIESQSAIMVHTTFTSGQESLEES